MRFPFSISSDNSFSKPFSFYYYYLVEAHNSFVQCVAWAPAPLTEASENADRIFSVVATGGTDKVNIGNYTDTMRIHSQLRQVIKIWRRYKGI